MIFRAGVTRFDRTKCKNPIMPAPIISIVPPAGICSLKRELSAQDIGSERDASSYDAPVGISHTQPLAIMLLGTRTYSANPPSIPQPKPVAFRHKFSCFPDLHILHLPHAIVGYITTRMPTLSPCTLFPMAAMLPVTSCPNILGGFVWRLPFLNVLTSDAHIPQSFTRTRMSSGLIAGWSICVTLRSPGPK